MDLNKKAFVKSDEGLFKRADDKLRKFGAFNAFFTNNDQTPADIAGDLNNNLTLYQIFNHFLTSGMNEIHNAFITP